MKRIKKLLSIIVAVTLLTISSACLSFDGQGGGAFIAAMVTDTGGVNDQSFNQSAWTGLINFKEKYGDKVKVTHIESKQEGDYASNLDSLVDVNSGIIFGIGHNMLDAILKVAKININSNFAIIDATTDNIPNNLTTVMFKSQQGAFLVGYIAALTTKTNKVGFVGGMKGNIIDQFEYGYRAGVDYASVELNKNIEIISQYTDSYTDSAKGKAVAEKIISKGADIVFHASGGCGPGIIAAAETNNIYAIGVDQDQAYLSPDHVLTSSLKNVSTATFDISERIKYGESIGGKYFEYGMEQGAVGIPQEHRLMGEQTYNKAKALEKKLEQGIINVPYNEETYRKYDKKLNH